jgi:hypothetical protein
MKRKSIDLWSAWLGAIVLILGVLCLMVDCSRKDQILKESLDISKFQKNTNKPCCVSVSSNQELVDKRWTDEQTRAYNEGYNKGYNEGKESAK